MSFMSVDDDGFDPDIGHARRIEERRQAYEALMRRLGWLRRLLLRHLHSVIDLFAGTRDTPKYHIVLFNYAVRRRALIEGRRLVAAGRLDAPGHVFDLTFDELESAASDPNLDLRQLRAERTRFLSVLKAQVKHFPSLIEVLHNPHEKPINKGDILVAYTTDPGWTPLFVNAAAVILEVGGMLQHGAAVAREYGKPCVAGIDGVMTKLKDAQLVEVDGTAGIVRLLSNAAASN